MRSEPLPSDSLFLARPPRVVWLNPLRSGLFHSYDLPAHAKSQSPGDRGRTLAQPSKPLAPRRLVTQNASQETAFTEPWQITLAKPSNVPSGGPSGGP